MKKKIIIIIGLPGSGKTYLIKQRFSNRKKYIVFDDVKAGAVFDCSNFCFSRYYPEIIKEMKLGQKNIVIADISFCNNESYTEAKKILEWWIKNPKLSYKIRSIFFKNEPEKCIKNIEKDNNPDNESRILKINNFSKQYFLDDILTSTDEVLEVYND